MKEIEGVKKFEVDDTGRKPGERFKGVISKIEDGKLGEFIPQETLDKWENADPEQPVFNAHIESASGIKFTKTFSKPTGEKIVPQSNIAKFQLKFGALKKGAEVETIVNHKGFEELDL